MIDAMGTQKGIAEKIIEKGAGYILQVKGNQPALMEDIALYFEKDVFTKSKKALGREGLYHKEICNDHDRIEIREYYVSDGIDWLLQGHNGWVDLQGITSKRKKCAYDQDYLYKVLGGLDTGM